MRSFLYTHLKIRNDDDWDRIKIQALTNPRKSRQAERGERERERENQSKGSGRKGRRRRMDRTARATAALATVAQKAICVSTASAD